MEELTNNIILAFVLLVILIACCIIGSIVYEAAVKERKKKLDESSNNKSKAIVPQSSGRIKCLCQCNNKDRQNGQYCRYDVVHHDELGMCVMKSQDWSLPRIDVRG